MDTFEPADAERFRRGYPARVELVDGHKDEKRASQNALKAWRSGDPDVYRVTWPRAVAHAYVRLYAAGDRTATTVDTSPPTVDELRALLARVVPGLVETYGFHTLDAIYIAEAVLGSEVVANAILDRLEQLDPRQQTSNNYHHHEFRAADALGYMWARCTPAAASALARRRDAILGEGPPTGHLGRRLALLPDQPCDFLEGEPIFREAYLQSRDGAARRAYDAHYHPLDEWSVRFHWLEGCDGLRTHPMKNLHVLTKYRAQQLLDDYGRLKHPGVVRLVAHLAHRSYVSAAAHEWLAKRRDHAETALEELAGADEACRDVLATLRGQPKTKPERPKSEEALLALVYEHPEDDEARLVLADHYSEKGDPRGELIVAQVHVARGQATAAEIKRATTLTNRADVRKLVFGSLAPALAPGHSRIERGFLAHAHVQKRTKELAADPAWATVTSLELEVSSAKAEDVLLDQPAVLRGLTRVGGLYPDAFARLATGNGDNVIEEVYVNLRYGDANKAVRAMASQVPGLPRLERITVRTDELGPDALAPLLHGKVGAPLKRLGHDTDDIERDLVAWLALPLPTTGAELHLHWVRQYAANWFARLARGEDGRLSALTVEHVTPPEKQFMPFLRTYQYFNPNDATHVARMAATATLWIARVLETIGVDALTRFTLVNDGGVPIDPSALDRLTAAARRQTRLTHLELPPVCEGVVRDEG